MRNHDKNIDSYTVIYNSVLKDTNISNEARGLFCYMLSNDENWEITERGLVKETGASITKIKNSIKELMNCGYIQRERFRVNGKLSGTKYVLNELPNNYVPNIVYPNKKQDDNLPFGSIY